MNFCPQVCLLKVLGRFPLNKRIARSEREWLFCEKFAPNGVGVSTFNFSVRVYSGA